MYVSDAAAIADAPAAALLLYAIALHTLTLPIIILLFPFLSLCVFLPGKLLLSPSATAKFIAGHSRAELIPHADRP